MNEIYKNYIYSAPRHNRLMFFLDSKTPIKKVIRLFQDNMKQWGGRYNPIIPIRNGDFSLYADLIKLYDPDYIFYNSNVNISDIKSTGYFNPKKYVELNETGNHYNFNEGVDYHYILNDKIHGELFRNRPMHILKLTTDLNKELPAQLFYETNFSLFRLFAGQDYFLNEYKIINVGNEDLGRVNEIIHRNKPFFKNILSQIYLNTTICKPKDYWATNNFELVVYDENNDPINDLIYFWNRQLYIDSEIKLKQIIVSKAELMILIKDELFEGVLYDLVFDSKIDLKSTSISKDELGLIKEELQSKFKNVKFDLASEKGFPYEIRERKYENEFATQNKIKSVIIGKKDVLQLTAPSFNKRIDIKGNYAIDIEIEKDESDNLKNIKFPFKAPIHDLISILECRVNGVHDISLFVSEQTKTIHLEIPDNYKFFHTLLYYREENNNYVSTGLKSLQLSNDGRKLSAFLQLFDNDWNEVESFIEDKFWLNLFRYKSEIKENKTNKNNNSVHDNKEDKVPDDIFWKSLFSCTSQIVNNKDFKSNIPDGKGVYSYKDIRKELGLLYRQYIKDIASENRAQELNKEQLCSYIKKNFLEDFDLIDSKLQYLLNKDSLFMGMKVRCNNCGSNSWYALKELGNKMFCKGCNSEIIPKLQSELFYRLNETIINNLIQKDGKNYEGNYIVLRTLIHLKTDSRNSFLYSPPMDYRYFINDGLKSSDIDILAIQDGKLIIGEAKCNASEFGIIEQNNLIWLGNNLKPDKIILAYKEQGSLDTIKQKAMKIKTQITTHSCEVIPYKIESSVYRFRLLSGL